MTDAGRSRAERWSLAGATALVTGGSKGIGHAIVEKLAGFGAHVHTCARNAAELEVCRRRWEEKGIVVTVSVSGKLDILVNNAGLSLLKPAVECTAVDYARIMATNLESCFHLNQLAHPLLRNASIAGGGSIVHISFIASFIALPGEAPYCFENQK